MKYNQPFDQPSNPNAPYVDGNPSAGIQGSIVPAASIEYPQREIVAAVQAAGLTPSNDDLGQLIKFVKCVDVFNIFKSAVNQGNASQWSVTIPALPTMPPPLGTALWIKPGYDSVNGGTVLSVNGGAFAAVVHADLSPVTISDIIPTGWLLVFFDGSRWQIVAGGSTRVPGLLPALTANANWFVNGTTGSDTVYDGTSATVASATKGPFKTIQRAASETAKYNMNGYNQSINVADGAYANATMPSTNGVGTVFVYGNPASPQNCTVTNSGGGSALVMNAGGSFDVNGFRLAGGLDGLDVQSTGTHCACRNLRFGACGRAHLVVSNGANLVLNDGVFIIEAGGNAQEHILAESTGFLTIPVPTSADWPTLSILGAVNISRFISAVNLGICQLQYGSMAGKGSVTGAQYAASGNALIDTLGGGAGYYPGTAAGALATGGQYV